MPEAGCRQGAGAPARLQVRQHRERLHGGAPRQAHPGDRLQPCCRHNSSSSSAHRSSSTPRHSCPSITTRRGPETQRMCVCSQLQLTQNLPSLLQLPTWLTAGMGLLRAPDRQRRVQCRPSTRQHPRCWRWQAQQTCRPSATRRVQPRSPGWAALGGLGSGYGSGYGISRSMRACEGGGFSAVAGGSAAKLRRGRGKIAQTLRKYTTSNSSSSDPCWGVSAGQVDRGCCAVCEEA